MPDANATIKPDVLTIKEHLDQLFTAAEEYYPDGLIEIRYGVTALNQHCYFTVDDAGRREATDFAFNRNVEGANVYVGVNPRRRATNTTKAASDSDVEIAFFNFADLDSKEAVDNAKGNLAIRPNMFVRTGTVPHLRPHFYWRLEEPVGNMDAWRDAQRAIAENLGGDKVINPSRVMRLAGSISYPPEHKQARGYIQEVTSLKDNDMPPVSPEEIRSAFPPRPVAAPERPLEHGQTTLAMMAEDKVEMLLRAALSGSEWHNNVRDLVATLVARGRTDVEIMAMAPKLTLPGYSVVDTEDDLQKLIDSARNKYMVPNAVPVSDATPVTAADIKVVRAFDFDVSNLPPRPWLIPGVMLERHTHMLVAPGGSGKSLFSLQLAIALATGEPWGEFRPVKRCRTLIINIEDDIFEQRRRLAGARAVMNPNMEDVIDNIFLAENPEDLVVAKVNPQTKAVIATPVASALIDYIKENQIDVLNVDPFTETFEGDENSNSEVKWAMKIWRDIARETGCAIYLIHHTTKGAAGRAGDADIIRGASAIVNSTRISATLMTMTEEDAKSIGIDPKERFKYVRYDDAKANLSLMSATAKWFEKVTVDVGNGTALHASDKVGALVPWTPPSAFDGITLEKLHQCLDAISTGVVEDGRPINVLFTANPGRGGQSSTRWVGNVIMDHLGVTDDRAKTIIRTWMRNGLLHEIDFFDHEQRKNRKGLAVNNDLRPDSACGMRFE